MEEFFSLEAALKKVSPRTSSVSQDLMDGLDSDMDKSILLYTHMLKCARERIVADNDDGLINILISCRTHHDREIRREDAEFFLTSLQHEDKWKQVADFYWAFCVVHYKVMTELKLLDNLDHVAFNLDGSIKGVRNIYGRADKDGKHLLGLVLGTLVITYFTDHVDEYLETLRLVKMNSNIDKDTDAHMNEWGHCLLAYLTVMMFGGGVLNYNKFVRFCKDYNITADTKASELYSQALQGLVS